ncbi:hypothetical protein C9374_004338 [Naegleria lovaniensis]|uniref:5-oxoprolinase n=1 Tax=Naegleria lovaniensis TaxID=51637 RepID=A0AA88GSB1_NAELO|nr:uncharacterized protein C9374_004338 [Naegleria lovaniensis]KAG2383667.1 hypothetical protein C9374_004338 [Naegleria lovaniensis]
MIRAVPRGQTACVDAYLSPIIKEYVKKFCAGFSDYDKLLKRVTFMQSNGGLTPAANFKGCNSILSGPAGGVVGYAQTSYNAEDGIPVLALILETETAGVTIQAPQLDITTVAAGGGSRLFFTKSGVFQVGPESVGANPGPVCYRKQTLLPQKRLAITDANLFLGRLMPEFFPKIFGPQENEPLDYEVTKRAFEELTNEVNEFELKRNGDKAQLKSPEEVAYGFIQVANESMSRPIRSITVAKGYDTREHILCSFGGAGAQHCQAIARNLGMKKVFIPRQSGILSAYGLGLADVVFDEQEPCAKAYETENFSYFTKRLEDLRIKVVDDLKRSGFDDSNIKTTYYLNMKYKGTDYSIMTTVPEKLKKEHDGLDGDYLAEFEKAYKREYGFIIAGRSVIVDDIRVVGIGSTPSISKIEIPQSTQKPQPMTFTKTYFEEGWTETAVYNLENLGAGDEIQGPAIIIHETTTILVEPNGTASITKYGDVEITLSENSISTNIKERLDFSCALFSPGGDLIANAPHLPVHLGSMSEAVKFQIKHLGDSWKEGEVIIANHPCAGGTHLPDITVITPVYSNGRVVFYVANRGHHADIGSISPGSMPPFSRLLSEEGMAIISLKIVEDGVFQEERITQQLQKSGARCIKDNIADLKAQIAANTKGISLLQDLINEYSLEVVQSYMQHVQDNAELAVREMLQQVFDDHAQNSNEESIRVLSEDFMDDGSVIKLNLTIRNQRHEQFKSDLLRKLPVAEFDFTGTSEMVLGNINAPKAITTSAILYSLRCLVRQDIPLNQGCLEPITIKIEKHSLLDIGEDGIVGVVAGNVLTSQRITDIILKAFSAAACSQGCMNNFTFGNQTFGYYETIAGGAGAGPYWNGCSGVHTHMTNTRITDVEILERRYPLVVKQFSLRPNTGGHGKFRGGDGVNREFEFLEPLRVGILSERRVFSPSGLLGGENGAKGKNILVTKSGLVHNLGGKNSFDVQPHDHVLIQTPGGGGFGKQH